MPKRGQPKTSFFVRFSVIYKVVQYMQRYRYSPYKAWMKLTKHGGFRDLMMDHYKNRQFQLYLTDRICNEYETKKNFYKNHVKKVLYSKLGKACLKERGLKL